MSRKLSEHVEDELFNKEKRVIPSVDPKKVIKTTPKIVKESVLGSVENSPVKKKKPYYRKKNNKSTPDEFVTPKLYKNTKVEPFKLLPEPKKYIFSKELLIGFGIGLVVGLIIKILT